MQIRKAYLFGRTLKPGGTPPMNPEIYFENGVFNPLYVPQGFDFNNNQHKVAGQDIYLPDYEFPSGYLEDGSVIQLQIGEGQNPVANEVCEIGEDGYLHIQHNPSAEQSSAYRDYNLGILLPITNITEILQTYRYIYFDFRFLSSWTGSQVIGWTCYRKETSTKLSDDYEPGYWDMDVPKEEVDWDVLHGNNNIPEYIQFDINVYERKNRPFAFDWQICKIYFTNG